MRQTKFQLIGEPHKSTNSEGTILNRLIKCQKCSIIRLPLRQLILIRNLD